MVKKQQFDRILPPDFVMTRTTFPQVQLQNIRPGGGTSEAGAGGGRSAAPRLGGPDCRLRGGTPPWQQPGPHRDITRHVV